MTARHFRITNRKLTPTDGPAPSTVSISTTVGGEPIQFACSL